MQSADEEFAENPLAYEQTHHQPTQTVTSNHNAIAAAAAAAAAEASKRSRKVINYKTYAKGKNFHNTPVVKEAKVKRAPRKNSQLFHQTQMQCEEDEGECEEEEEGSGLLVHHNPNDNAVEPNHYGIEHSHQRSFSPSSSSSAIPDSSDEDDEESSEQQQQNKRASPPPAHLVEIPQIHRSHPTTFEHQQQQKTLHQQQQSHQTQPNPKQEKPSSTQKTKQRQQRKSAKTTEAENGTAVSKSTVVTATTSLLPNEVRIAVPSEAALIVDLANNNSVSSQASDVYIQHVKRITETLQAETERSQKKYEENQKKIDQWRREVKIAFELSEEEGDYGEIGNSGDDSSHCLKEEVEEEINNDGGIVTGSTKKIYDIENTVIDKLLSTQLIDRKLAEAQTSKDQIKTSGLEQRLAYLTQKRKLYFKRFLKQHRDEHNKDIQSSDSTCSSATTIERIIAESSRIQSTANSKKIEHELFRLASTIESSRNDIDPIEQALLKKFKVNTEKLLARPNENVGLKTSDFRRIKKYKTSPLVMPFCGSNFDEAKKTLVPQYHAVFNDHSDPFNRLISKPIIPRSSGQGGRAQNLHINVKPSNNSNNNNNNGHEEYNRNGGVDHLTSSPLKMRIVNSETFADWNEIALSMNRPNERDIQKQRKMEKMEKMTQEDKDKYIRILFKKSWQQVVRNVLKIYRFAQQYLTGQHIPLPYSLLSLLPRTRSDNEQNSRKFAILCSKEVRKKYSKSQRTAKDWAVRGKKMHREMIGYWRKRERELIEIKRRKEKLEAELKRREDEERETLLQKKRLEFLMRQSDLYAHFMAQKLGIAMNDKDKLPTDGQPQQPSPQSRIQMVAIDENEAANVVSDIINDRRAELVKFDLATAKERMMLGQEEDQILVSTEKQLISAQDFQNKMDFSQVEPETQNSLIKPPVLFSGNLKEYQLKGLRWLDNLYEQGINGILADEMGLGKTIQAIALVAHIASTKNIWGPFLVIAPSSTLYNWQQELKKFFPALKVLPYWGSSKQRKMIRKYFSAKNLGFRNSPFHLVITSYQLIVSDEKVFHRIKWQYMILDEAQAIKSVNSMRWKTLLSFNSRNKLLLTGTPIQNTMAELWALLHFIMPKLFDSHEQFQEWFSKDIEASSQDKSQLNEHQLQRLHAILKPFMLRRVKKDVEHELGAKKEFQIMCDMTRRQQKFYDHVKSKLSLTDFFRMFESKQKVDNLMNLVMQFRKVCNHPELFERRACRSSFICSTDQHYTGHLPARLGEIKLIETNVRSPIIFELPKLIYDEVLRTETKTQLIQRYFGFLTAAHVLKDLYTNKNSIFAFIRLLDLPLNIMEVLASTDQLYLQIILLHLLQRTLKVYAAHQASGEKYYTTNNLWWSLDILQGQRKHTTHVSGSNRNSTSHFDISQRNCSVDQIASIYSYKCNDTILYRPTEDQKFTMSLASYPHHAHNGLLPVKLYCMVKKVMAPPIRQECSSVTYQAQRQALYEAKFGRFIIQGSSTLYHRTKDSSNASQTPTVGRSLVDVKIIDEGMLDYRNQETFANIEVVDFASLVADSSKLKYLDALLTRLKRDGHRVLIFCQMTRMIDILEDFMTRKKYKYFRLDGSSNISDRRDMVNDFQSNDKTFVFLLSTRAGGLGVTLTAADVVIFYDNDWNPTMDAQAMDRAHRIGQTKEVQVYRLVTRGTVEERILKRAQQKQQVQSTVYSGGAFKADIWKPREVMELLLDENEIKETQMFMPKRKQGLVVGSSGGSGNSTTTGAPKQPSRKAALAAAAAAKEKKQGKPTKKKESSSKLGGQATQETNMGEEGGDDDDLAIRAGGDDEEGMEVEGFAQDEEYGIDFENIMEDGVAERQDPNDIDNADDDLD